MQITKILVTANQKPSTFLQYSPDNTEVITAGQDSLIKVFCAYTGEQLEQYGPHGTGVAISSISISPDQRYIAVALRDAEIIIHDRQEYETYKKLTEDSKRNYCKYKINLKEVDKENNLIECTYSTTILFDKQQKYLYVTVYSHDQSKTQIRKYSFPELKIIKSKDISESIEVLSSILSPDDQILYIAENQGFSYYRTEDLSLIEQENLSSRVFDLTWFRKQFLVVPCYDLQKVYIFDTKNAQDGEVEDIYDIDCYNFINSAAVFDDQKYNLLLVGGGIDPKLVAQTKEGNKTATEIYDLITKKVLFSKVYHGSPITKVRISSDQQSFSSIAVDGTLFILRINLPDYKPRSEWY